MKDHIASSLSADSELTVYASVVWRLREELKRLHSWRNGQSARSEIMAAPRPDQSIPQEIRDAVAEDHPRVMVDWSRIEREELKTGNLALGPADTSQEAGETMASIYAVRVEAEWCQVSTILGEQRYHLAKKNAELVEVTVGLREQPNEATPAISSHARLPRSRSRDAKMGDTQDKAQALERGERGLYGRLFCCSERREHEMGAETPLYASSHRPPHQALCLVNWITGAYRGEVKVSSVDLSVSLKPGSVAAATRYLMRRDDQSHSSSHQQTDHRLYLTDISGDYFNSTCPDRFRLALQAGHGPRTSPKSEQPKRHFAGGASSPLPKTQRLSTVAGRWDIRSDGQSVEDTKSRPSTNNPASAGRKGGNDAK